MILNDISYVAFLWQAFMFGFLVAWMYFLYEIITSGFRGREGMLWGLFVFFVPVIGLLAYLAYGRSTRTVKNIYQK
ncbi:PLDc N-terminal domain-containing protein [Salinimicrobium sp. TH3]|uniref:PLDc N-terminal domain-containing protein n=1 Tax=Salinimicrobium sp. TH3 TaxID=2997342 RepID=UPI00227520C6|nr:PLDc N-terminal domain-containing protein [Salinimicrobium sp. TH3]MCY2687474.1 PLDc N-terminal domain-containing protein [Salinimicrobium sp. TH3]